MNDFGSLHPICIFAYFVVMIVMLLICNHPLVMISASVAAVFLLLSFKEHSIKSMLKWVAPIILIITIANPLLNHKGVTRVCFLFGQWITWEAICYGVASGLSLAALILWFSCYQKIMTSDKFLYLFGKAAPASSLLITMALAFVPKLQLQLNQIQECQEMITGEAKTTGGKIRLAIRNVSVLLGWSLENTVEQADSMKARGYGIRRRTTFHLFRMKGRDVRFLMILFVLSCICFGLRIHGCGTMEFYPRISEAFRGTEDMIFYISFLVLAGIPGVMEWKEEVLWRSYNLNL